jgi:CubicO group peptidase (beta-lactamase class C family)
MQFGVAVGPKTYKHLPDKIEGLMEADDMMGLGSGTKGFTAAAIMRLVDQGKVKLEDPAYLHIDQIMSRDMDN